MNCPSCESINVSSDGAVSGVSWCDDCGAIIDKRPEAKPQPVTKREAKGTTAPPAPAPAEPPANPQRTDWLARMIRDAIQSGEEVQLTFHRAGVPDFVIPLKRPG